MGAGYYGKFGNTQGSNRFIKNELIFQENEQLVLYKVVIMNKYLHSPIWIYNKQNVLIDELPIVNNDKYIQKFSDKATKMFANYYEFDINSNLLRFNHEKQIKEKKIMIGIISNIVTRLEEINDGSFIIEDLETERLNSL